MTEFNDTNVAPLTTYSYRVKASSDNPDDYSNTATVTTEGTYYVCGDALTLPECGSYVAADPNQGNGALNSSATHAVWFEFIPPFSGEIDIYSCLGGVDTRLWVYSGSCGSLTLIANNDDECEMTPGSNTYASEILNLSVTKDTPILLEWDDRWSSSGFSFHIDLTATDPCADAEELLAEGTFTIENISCGEGASQPNATHAIFYKFIPPTDGVIDITSCNEEVDTRLWVYSGTCGSLTLTHSSDNDCNAGGGLGNVAASISGLNVAAGTPIYLEWDDRWSGEGFDFNISYQGACPNDYDLSGIQTVSNDFETDGQIVSSQTIEAGLTVDYDSGIEIVLQPGFEILLSAVFNAIIDGCGGAQ